MIEIAGLSKSFGNLKVLDDVSMVIARGTVTGLLGPNASGKSTLIKSILGLVNPDAGCITVDGEPVVGEWRYRRRIGYMPQATRFPDNLTVDELFAMLRDLRDSELDIDIELFARYDLGTIGGKRLGTLSGGTRQKVNAAIAFMFNPRVLILDEPTVGLDPVSTAMFKDKVRKARDSGSSVLISSHLVSEVEELSDQVVYLLEGRTFFDGTVEEIRLRGGEKRLERAIVNLVEAEDDTRS